MTNPYQATEAPIEAALSAREGEVDEASLHALEGTRGWVRLLAIVGMILSALMLLGALGLIGAGAAGLAGEGEAFVFIGMGVGYLVGVALWLYPLLVLYRYASRIDDVLASGSLADLAPALDAQRRFFRFVGLFTVVMIAIYLLAIVAAVAIPAFLSL